MRTRLSILPSNIGSGSTVSTTSAFVSACAQGRGRFSPACDGGRFLRSSEKGEAYQVLLDYRDKGTLFGVYGERLKDVVTYNVEDWRKYWKENEWNSVRARIEGDIPRITVWVNGRQTTAWSDTSNHAAGGALDGMIAVQVHGGNQIWKAGGKHRFRNIAVRELPN